MNKTVAVLNEKGGVGKTTSIVEIAYHAGSHFGKKVLVIDLDPQSNSTRMLVGNHETKSFYDLITNSASLAEVIVPAQDNWKNTLVFTANRQLGVIENQLTQKLSREFLLRKAIDPIKDKFDLILIDLPPTTNSLTVNALVAANGFIIPTDLSDFSSGGIELVKNLAETIASGGLNPTLKFIGIFITSFQKGGSIAVRQILSDLESAHKEYILPIRIPHSVKVTESHRSKIPVGQIEEENHPVNQSYRSLTGIVLEDQNSQAFQHSKVSNHSSIFGEVL
jgi:chromosome partitioning protein